MKRTALVFACLMIAAPVVIGAQSGAEKPRMVRITAKQAQAASTSSDPLPEGKGKDLVETKCQLCHTEERIVSTRRTKEEWHDIVKLMWDRRAPFSEDDIPTIADYLFKNFGKPDPVYPPQVSMPIPDGYDFTKPVKRGTITGTVTADNGPVHTFSVEAHNLLYRVRYYVFTKDGSYTVPQALPGPYEITPYQRGYKGPAQKVKLEQGETQAANLVVKKDPEKEEPGVAYIDINTVFTPGPGRDLYFATCRGCHLSNDPHFLLQLSEYGYRMGIENMRWGRRVPEESGPTMLGRTQLSTEQMDLIGHYLGSLFDPSIKREIKRPEYPLDEDVVSKAIFVQYDLPDEIVNSHPGEIGFHDAFYASDGSAWFGSSTPNKGGPFIVRVDPKEPDPRKRMKFFYAPSGEDFLANGIGEDKIRHEIYFSDALNGRLGEVNVAAGTIRFHNAPMRGFSHGLAGDSKGNIWFTNLQGSSLDKYDPKTGQAYSYPTITEDTGTYGVVEDHEGNLWVPGNAKDVISKFDPRTQTMTEYRTPTKGSGVRRARVDSKGNVWFSESAVGGFARIVPETGEITEYKLPVTNISPYSVWVDKKDENVVWGDDFINSNYLHDYGFSPFSYNVKTKKMYYFPSPRGTFGPETFTEPNNTEWFTAKKSKAVGVHFYPEGYAPDAPPEP